MSVAPTFRDWPILCDVYIKNGRRYVRVRNPKTGAEREVRWYPENRLLANDTYNDESKPFDMLKHARGFDNGPILVIRGNKSEDENWLKNSVARFAVGIGWYIISTEQLPADAPKHFKYLLLSWDEFRYNDETHMKTPAEIASILSHKEARKEWIKFS